MVTEKTLGFLGCDPGLSGGFTAILGDTILYKIAMPTITFGNAKDNSKKTEIDRKGVLSFLKLFPEHTHVVIEKQEAYRGQNIGATGTTLKNYGILLMGLTATHFFITETPSDVWHDFYGIVSVKKAKGKTTKQQALPIAQALFPGVDFRKSGRSHVQHDGIVDGALLAYYCQSLFPHAITKAPSDAYLDWCDKQGVFEER